MKKNIVTLLLVLLCLCSAASFGQIPSQIFYDDIDKTQYNSKDFVSTKTSLEKQVGNYHFGESEGEWNLVLLKRNDSFFIIVKYDVFVYKKKIPNGKFIHKKKSYNVILKGNRIYFGKYNGLFAEYNQNGVKAKALLLSGNPISNEIYNIDTAEVGWCF